MNTYCYFISTWSDARCVVWVSRALRGPGELAAIAALKDLAIDQKTPIRVLHRCLLVPTARCRLCFLARSWVCPTRVPGVTLFAFLALRHGGQAFCAGSSPRDPQLCGGVHQPALLPARHSHQQRNIRQGIRPRRQGQSAACATLHGLHNHSLFFLLLFARIGLPAVRVARRRASGRWYATCVWPIVSLARCCRCRFLLFRFFMLIACPCPLWHWHWQLGCQADILQLDVTGVRQ